MKKIQVIFFLILFKYSSVYAQKVTTAIFNEPYINIKKFYPQQPLVFYDSEFRAYKELPFVFLFNEIVSEYLAVYGPGYINAVDVTDTNKIEIATFYPYFSENLIDKSYFSSSHKLESQLYFWIDTINNEQIFKVEWKNMGFKNCTINDSLNMQVWFYERTNKVQYRFGKSNLTDPNMLNTLDTTIIGFEVETISKKYFGAFNGSNNIYTYSYMNPFARVFGIPSEGTVIEIKANETFVNTSAKKVDKGIYVLQNEHVIRIKHSDPEAEILELSLYSLSGEKILECSTTELDVKNLATGMYVLKVLTNKGLYTHKYLK